MMGKIKDLTGKRYGRLTVLNLASIDSKGRTRWLCKCDCGNLKDVLSGSLTSGNVRSCGCYRKELIGVQGTKRKKNLVGQKFGKLTVLSDTGRRCGSNVVWHCQCECGRFNEVQGWCLQDGSVTTCGDCQLVSRGEEKIIELLNEHRIPYEHDTSILGFRFPDSGRLARFDFYIDNRYIVEYDGIQHFKQTQGNWGKLDTLEKRQNRDMYKDKFCFENDIPIIRIPYTHLNKLCLEDLLPETSPFLMPKKQ